MSAMSCDFVTVCCEEGAALEEPWAGFAVLKAPHADAAAQPNDNTPFVMLAFSPVIEMSEEAQQTTAIPPRM